MSGPNTGSAGELDLSRLRALINDIDGIVWELDIATMRFTFVSAKAEHLLGYPIDLWLSEPSFWKDHIHPEDREWAVDFCERQTKEKKNHEFVYRMIAADGRVVWLRDMVTVAVQDDQPVTLRGVMVDITERKQLEQQLIHNAFHDTLTGLANRALFLERLEQVFKRARRLDDQTFAILFLDLDRFKDVNDGLGHLAGDQLLIAIAGRLEKSVRDCDTVARFGGDEFAVLVDGLRHPREAMEIAERVRTGIRAPLTVASQEMFPTASIGITIHHRAYTSTTEMMRDADSAMYQAKDRGRDRCEVFDTAVRSRLESGLARSAEVGRNGPNIEFHKIYSVPDRQIAGYAAMAAAGHMESRIATAPVGWWILEEACKLTAQWAETAGGSHTPTLSVKVTGQQVSDSDFIGRLENLLASTAANVSRLRLELTETVFRDDETSLSIKLERLQQIGIGLQIEDFGAGYSLLRRLRRFPIDTVKTGFGIAGDREAMDASISLARGLKLRIIVEGVESGEHLALIEALGCDFAQGRHFGPALSGRQVLDEIASPTTIVQGASH